MASGQYGDFRAKQILVIGAFLELPYRKQDVQTAPLYRIPGLFRRRNVVFTWNLRLVREHYSVPLHPLRPSSPPLLQEYDCCGGGKNLVFPV